MNIRTVTYPQIPFTHYFQLNVPFYGYFPEATLYPCEVPPVFKQHPDTKVGITGDDGGCIRHEHPCQPIRPQSGEVGQKLHAVV